VLIVFRKLSHTYVSGACLLEHESTCRQKFILNDLVMAKLINLVVKINIIDENKSKKIILTQTHF